MRTLTNTLGSPSRFGPTGGKHRTRSVVLLLGLLSAIVLTGQVAGAQAAAPTITRGSFAVPLHSLGELCPGTDVLSSATVTYTERDYLDANGALTRVAYHISEQDTFTANGKTLKSEWLSFNFQLTFDSSGSVAAAYLSGIVERIPLPDGSLFISAGRIDYAARGFPDFVLTPDTGATHNLTGFCAALAP
jgi:hypothetical protein